MSLNNSNLLRQRSEKHISVQRESCRPVTNFLFLSCMYVLVSNEQHPRKSPGIFSNPEGRLTETSLPKNTLTDSRCLERLSDCSNCFSLLQTLNCHWTALIVACVAAGGFVCLRRQLPSSPLCLFCVSDIHRKRNYGFTTSTRPITVHERTATCKRQLEAIIKKAW